MFLSHTAEEQTNEHPAGESSPPEIFTSRAQETKEEEEEERRKKVLWFLGLEMYQ